MTRQIFKYRCLLYIPILLMASSAQAKFEFNPNCQQAMQAALDLRFKDARSLIEEERSLNPDNGYIIYLEHYTESIELIISEDQELYSKLIDHYSQRSKQMDLLDNGSPDNSWLQAEMLFHTGLAQVKFGTRLNGVSKLLSAYRKVRENRKKYPQFWQNQKLTGVYNIILDNIPPFVRWAADIFGYGGDSGLGLYQLKEYYNKAKTTPGLAEEAVLINGLGYKLSSQEEMGFQFMKELDNSLLNNILVKYLYANSAVYNYQNVLALKLLSEINESEIQVSFYSLHYLTGKCLLNHLENSANLPLEKYLNNFPGQDYKKDVCIRLSYYYLIFGEKDKYEDYRSMVSHIGQDLRDRDLEALLEVNTGIVPHVGLLKARLLCDGGYFDKALAIMKGIDQKSLDEIAYRLEYHYRMGRIMQLTGHLPEAINELTKTYQDGKSQPYTFATRAALQLGKIYEAKQEFNLAYEWYNRCSETFSPVHTTEATKELAIRGTKRVKGKG